MKNTLVLIFAIWGLSGCATWMPASFDPVEYNQYLKMQRAADNGTDSCKSPNNIRAQVVPRLLEQSKVLIVYTRNKTHSTNSFEMVKIINNNIVEMQARYGKEDPSETYCKSKLELIKYSAERAMSTLGKAPR